MDHHLRHRGDLNLVTGEAHVAGRAGSEALDLCHRVDAGRSQNAVNLGSGKHAAAAAVDLQHQLLALRSGRYRVPHRLGRKGREAKPLVDFHIVIGCDDAVKCYPHLRFLRFSVH